jgi:hypothetical protein
MSLRTCKRHSAAVLEIFWRRITEIPSIPKEVEEREEIANLSSLELKGMVRRWELGSILVGIGRSGGQDS